MRSRTGRAVFGAFALAATLGGAHIRAQPQPSDSVWTNPQRSVRVRAHTCDRAMCGTVIWANDKAKADARKGGTDPLVGTLLFQNFVPEGKSVWRGKVFVPDIRKTFSGTITQVDERTLRAQGCLIGRIGCRSQTWTKVEASAR